MRTRRVAFPLQRPDRLKRILNATGYSLAGFLAAFRGEAAFRQLVLLNVVLIPVAFLLDVSRGERALMIAVCLLALIVELLNSAIEPPSTASRWNATLCRRMPRTWAAPRSSWPSP